MCGIAGVLYSKPCLNEYDFMSLMQVMGDQLKHRGPDDHGEWVDVNAGVGFSHRRLSIIDLSSAGHQPMVSKNNRYVIIFNGEIYNYREVKADLEKSGVNFRGHSDTETLLECIAFKGLDKTLGLINGMFAFALWDKETRSLILARDRIGKKPLYYGWCNEAFLFGSELKALKIHPSFDDEIDRDALGQFIQYSWLNGPASIYKKLKKLQPGSYIKISQGKNAKEITPNIYWSALDKAKQAQANIYTGSYEDSVGELDILLNSAVKKRMIADVDLGALLSGGIDSSLVVSIMQSNSIEKVKTFSIGFNEETHNEALYAKKIAEYLGTEHKELYVTPKDCMDVIPKLSAIYDEPFADPSQIPTYLVSNLAGRHVKVALTGDGGDELFAGYTRYFRCQRHWSKQKLIPEFMHCSLSNFMEFCSNQLWNFYSTVPNTSLIRLGQYADKFDKRSRRICAADSLELFVMMMKRFKSINELVIEGGTEDLLYASQELRPNFQDEVLNMMMIDVICYLTDDILVKVDRASMANSLEIRSPILDKEIKQFAWRLPSSARYDAYGGKKILKDVLSRYLPPELTNRRKMGFGVPIRDWLRSSLRDWANDIINEYSINQQGYFNYHVVNKLWCQHKSGWTDHSEILWAILMFQVWIKGQ